MTTNESSNTSNANSWIISIAVSVLCCAVIFIVFASYITDVKKEVRESSVLINSIEAREVSIQQTLEIISKRLVTIAPAPVADAPAGTSPATGAVAPLPATTPTTATPSIAAPTVAEPAPSAPTIQVPVITPSAPVSPTTAPAVLTPSTPK